ncbi:MAG: carboxymuconolactone decarboxylase family protein [Alphaproteobacteria bacterium]|nr:MAG: carboxymuconolactone decarboxylase family protein [Alphaproteobacteria bacterium]
MTARGNYQSIAPDPTKKYIAFSMALAGSSIDAGLKHLIDTRVSQLNGCAFCVDMHVKEAKIHGERELRLHHVAIWWESPLFDARERMALEWAEILTNLPPRGVPDDVYARAREHFSEKELADLTFIIVAINGWNRLNAVYRTPPGALDKLYGLDKANLS